MIRNTGYDNTKKRERRLSIGRSKSSISLHLAIVATPGMRRIKFGSLRPKRTSCGSATFPVFVLLRKPLRPELERPPRSLMMRIVRTIKSSGRYADELAHQRASIDRQEVMLARLCSKFMPHQDSSGGDGADFVSSVFGDVKGPLTTDSRFKAQREKEDKDLLAMFYIMNSQHPRVAAHAIHNEHKNKVPQAHPMVIKMYRRKQTPRTMPLPLALPLSYDLTGAQ
ncbi:hypothetical protein M9H77_23064 [Catharanthus roseus]|uniref:Uncharacterized protein n=1 Tax=Catharanthus roseus TaxID=4058 RepID=A0ACC0ASY2_CATRO|nr:hypothetical protein M9H77_23064 [Catharanthus roseus]